LRARVRLVLVLAGATAAGCGDNAALVAPPVPTLAPSRTPTVARAAIPSGYTGLGARSAAFAGAHHESRSGIQPGVPLFSAVSTDPGGRVTGYTIRFNDRPSLSDYERLVAAAGIGDLPGDRVTVKQAFECFVYGSPGLGRLIGAAYVRVTTVRGASTATVRSVSTPGC